MIRALDLILPPLCPLCRGRVEGVGNLCASCWKTLRRLEPPYCEHCGLPTDGGPCRGCAGALGGVGALRAALAYDDASARLILPFKHGDALHVGPAIARLMLGAGGDLIEACDLLAPVPLHWTRLLSRRYNQAAIIARHLARLTGKPVLPDALRRVRRTPSQGHKNRAERSANIAAAILPHPRRDVAGRRVLLIDDVATTGATLSACARALKQAGASRVDALVLARALRDD